MNNLLAPLVPVELDRPRNIKVDFNALAAIEEKTGLNVLKGETWQNLNATTLRIFLWAGLLHEDPDLTLEQVGAMLHLGNAAEVGSKLTEAFSRAMPQEGGPKNRKRPIG